MWISIMEYVWVSDTFLPFWFSFVHFLHSYLYCIALYFCLNVFSCNFIYLFAYKLYGARNIPIFLVLPDKKLKLFLPQQFVLFVAFVLLILLLQVFGSNKLILLCQRHYKRRIIGYSYVMCGKLVFATIQQKKSTKILLMILFIFWRKKCPTEIQ